MGEVPWHIRPLTRDQAMRLLARAGLGRVVFTERALPAVRLASHLVDGSHVIIRPPDGTAIVTASDPGGTVVAYEADDIHPDRHSGWSVTVTGMAHLVGDQDQAERYQQLLYPCAGCGKDGVIRIEAEIVTGFELVSEPSAPR